MCYKYLWDNLITDKFPYKQFLNFFSLNPNHILCEDIRENTAKSGFPAQVYYMCCGAYIERLEVHENAFTLDFRFGGLCYKLFSNDF